jgi:putative flippase GtrA
MKSKSEMRSFLKFNLVGLTNTAVDIGFFSVLIAVHVSSGIAQVVGYTCGILNSFFWNRKWTFEHTGAKFGDIRFWKFVVSNVLVLGISTGWVVTLTKHGYGAWIAKGSSFGITLPLSYLFSRWALKTKGNA